MELLYLHILYCRSIFSIFPAICEMMRFGGAWKVFIIWIVYFRHSFGCHEPGKSKVSQHLSTIHDILNQQQNRVEKSTTREIKKKSGSLLTLAKQMFSFECSFKSNALHGVTVTIIHASQSLHLPRYTFCPRNSLANSNTMFTKQINQCAWPRFE